MKISEFKYFMDNIIHEFEREERHSSAHVYRSTRNSFLAFAKAKGVREVGLSAELLKSYENHLKDKQLSWNTISTYMRMLRASHNRAVEQGRATYVPHLFKGVYTGVKSQTKRALSPQAMARLMEEKTLEQFPESKWFVLMFLLRGIPFVDLAHLRKCDFNGGVINYHRRKTGRELSVSVPEEAMDIIRSSMDNTTSPYLFPILNGESRNGKETYKNYQSELRKFNYRLGLISKEIGKGTKLSSYVARHTWATTAYHKKMPMGIISCALGHSSVKVTEAYLKPFENRELEKMNTEIISYIKGYSRSGVTS